MCGRFTLAIDGDGLLRSYVATGRDGVEEWGEVYSVSPRTRAPVVREYFDENGEIHRAAGLARWGFQPAWAKEKGPRPINARFETVAANGMFRGAFTSSRAVVPMTGYFEWVETETGKQPYFIHHPDGALLHAAGLTAARKVEDPEGGEPAWDMSFTIITREARDASGEVHDRMPVFLTEETWPEWIAPGKLDADAKEHLHDLLEDSSTQLATQLVTDPVSRRVNNNRTLTRTDPTLIEPIEL